MKSAMRQKIFNYFHFMEAGIVVLIGMFSALVHTAFGGVWLVSMLIVLVSFGVATAMTTGLVPMPSWISGLRRVWIRPGDVANFLCATENTGSLIRVKGVVQGVSYGHPKPVSVYMELFLALDHPRGVWYCQISHGTDVHDVPFDWIASIAA